MIYTRIRGGLGNQLFQYCAARVLADSIDVDLGLDIREYSSESPFGMDLHHFKIRGDFNADGMIQHKDDGLFSYAIDIIRGKQRNIYKEAHLSFDPKLKTLGDNTYLKGYWQSEKYFRDSSKIIASDLKIITKPSSENIASLNQIESCLSVSLHIRRGDYVSNAKYNEKHGTCDLNYYLMAVNLLIEKLGNNIVIFAFSDDPDWVKENLKLPVKINYIRHNSSAKSYEDLRLMIHCQHHIIANSSFSWWGAWLDQNPEKIVIAPEQWFANPKNCNPDIFPPEWIRI